MDDFINRLLVGDAKSILANLPEGSVDLVITSPPYWTAVEYDKGSIESMGTYEEYLDALLAVWKACSRVLRPNGKMVINTPIMPVPKKIIGDQHTRHIKNINNDIEASILNATDFLRYSLFIWQKQTSKMMFGSYPFPGNIIENNTIEFINVFVKPGKPPRFDEDVKEINKLSQEEWIDLAQQIWFMYPEDVKREGDHPAPFPEKLPGRLIRMYTFGTAGNFPGEIILDPFCGTGTACAVAKRMGRRYVGIDISPKYIQMAQDRVLRASLMPAPNLFVGRGKYPTKEELAELSLSLATGNAGKEAFAKHKRETYGRSSPKKVQLGLGFEDSDSQELFKTGTDGQ